MPEMLIVQPTGEPTEYFCLACKQLRLSLIADKSKCGKCGSKDLITGPCGSLDKESLLRRCGGNKDSQYR